jgi:hypothetical protein
MRVDKKQPAREVVVPCASPLWLVLCGRGRDKPVRLSVAFAAGSRRDMRFPRTSARFSQRIVFGVVVAVTLGASRVQGQQPEAAPERPLADVVDVQAGATCLDAERLTLRIGRWREHETVDARIRVKVRGDAKLPNRVAFSVTKEGGESAERTLADAPTDCDQLHSAVALAVALSIDATLMDQRAQAEAALPLPPAPDPAPPPPVPASKLLPEREPPPTAAPRPMHLELAVMVGPVVRLFEDTTFMTAPRLTLTPWPWLGLAVVGFVTSASAQAVGDAKGSFDALVAAGGADACAGVEPDPRLSLQACGGARIGVLSIEGVGFQRNFDHVHVWPALTGSTQVRAWLTADIAVGAGVSLYVPLVERTVRVEGKGAAVDQLYELPRPGIGVEFGPVFRFF